MIGETEDRCGQVFAEGGGGGVNHVRRWANEEVNQGEELLVEVRNLFRTMQKQYAGLWRAGVLHGAGGGGNKTYFSLP